MLKTGRSIAANRRPRCAAGLATQELLVLIIAVLSIGTLAAFVGPQIIRAGAGPSLNSTPDPLAEGLRGMIESSVRVLGVSSEPLTGDTFVVLWGADTTDIGVVNRGEIVVLHHSVIRRVVSAWVCVEPKDLFKGIGDPPPDTRRQRVREAAVTSEEFGPAWVIAPDIQRRVIATAVRDFRCERISRTDRTRLLRIRLTRGPGTSDGEPEELVFEARSGASLGLGQP